MTCNTTTFKCTNKSPCTQLLKQCNNTQECIIQCIGNGVCSDSQFVCPTDNDCTLICDSLGSSTTPCKNVNLMAENSTNIDVNIMCINTKSCENVLVNASNVNNINIICTTNQTGSASSTDIIIHAEYIRNNVNILCDGDYTCYQSIVYANYSNKMNIIANGGNVLHYSQIYAYSASSFKLSCYSPDKTGCDYPSIYLPQSDTSNIALNCSGFGCKNLIFYALNGFRDIDSLYLDGCHSCTNIGGDANDGCIFLWRMHCGNEYTEYSRLWGSYCDDISCGCMHYGLPLIGNEWKNSDIVCDTHQTTILCENDMDCNINCSGYYQCNNGLINGLNAKSLNIICDNYQDCDSLAVYCPSNGECNLMCSDHRSCDKALIYGTNGDKINIFCNNAYSCNSMEIHAYNATNISLVCKQSNSCHHLQVFGTGTTNIHILCDYSSETYQYSPCFGTTIYGENVNQLHIKCNANYSCYNNYIYAENTDKIIITATGDHGLYEPYIYTQNVDNFTLICIGEDVYYGCHQLTLYIEGSNTNINCIYYGCSALTIHDNYIANDINTISVTGNCHTCNTTDSCIIQWDLKCSGHDYFNGKLCETDYCDCSDLQKKIKEGWSMECDNNTDDNNTDDDQNDKKQDGIHAINTVSWIAIIAIIVSMLIIFIVIICSVLWYIRKKQQDQINHINLVNEAVEKKQSDGDDKDHNNNIEDSDDNNNDINHIAIAEVINDDNTINPNKKQNIKYKKMIDQLDYFDYEEGR